MNKITIVTVTYNCASILEETIKSCINQDYDNSEYIIIDGQSNDDTIRVIKNYENEITYWSSEPDRGVYDAMNKGIKKATGDWIIFMNAGDCFAERDVLSRIFKKHIDENVGVIYGQNKAITKKGIVYKNNIIPFWKQKTRYRNMGFNHQSVFVDLNILRKENLLFDLSFKLCADYYMIHTIHNKGYDFVYVPFSISIIDGINGLSANNRKLQRVEEARVCGCDKSISFFIYNTYKELRSTLKMFILHS